MYRDSLDAHLGTLARTKEITEVTRRIRKNDQRDVMVDIIWRGLREAIASAPDAFPPLDTHALAVRVVDQLILGG